MSHRSLLALVALLALGGCQNQIVDETPPPTSGHIDEQDVSCEDDSDCPSRAICRGGLCEDVGAGCVVKSECSFTEVCIAGTCAPPTGTCATSEECPGATMCDGFSRTCFDPNASGCEGDGECALEPGCEEGCTCAANGLCVPVVEEPGTDPDPVDPPPTGPPIELGGYVLENRETEPATQLGVLPAGLSLQPGQRLVIGRNANRSDFQDYWGVPFGADVVYLNAEVENAGVPIVNGGERWALLSPLGTVVDGTTIVGSKERSYRRIAVGNASSPSNWREGPADDAAPGDRTLPSTGVGLVISQWSDASTFRYEFVELYYAP